MYVSFNDARGFALHAHDAEELGTLRDLYVDTQDWSVRWLVIETGGWFSSNRVLVGTTRVGSVDVAGGSLRSALRREEIESAPPASSDPPAAERAPPPPEVLALSGGHGLFMAGHAGMLLPYALYESVPAPRDGAAGGDERESADGTADDMPAGRDLRSCDELRGYAIGGVDGDIGAVRDLVIDPRDWSLAWLVVDTGKWLPGERVVLSPRWLSEVSFPDRRVSVRLTREQVREAPPFAALEGLERSYEERLQAYYGYPMF